MALAAYRHLLRGIRIAFKNDTRLLTQARLQARNDFQAHRSLESGSHVARDRIQHAEQVASLLRHNVVQGSRVVGEGEADANNQGTGQQQWHLNIHRDTELGDNESIKTAGVEGAQGGSIGDGCCQTTSGIKSRRKGGAAG